MNEADISDMSFKCIAIHITKSDFIKIHHIFYENAWTYR